MIRLVLLGCLAVLVVAAIVVVGAFVWFDRSIRADIDRLEAEATDPGHTIDAADLDELPAPVRRYLAASGVVGKAVPRLVRLSQTGRLRGSPDAGWMAFGAEQVYSISPPALVWRAWFPSRAMPVVMGRDVWLGDGASIVMKMLGLVSVADDRRAELKRAVMLRFLNEMMWFPQAYLGDAVSWRAIDETSAEVTLNVAGESVSGTVFFDSDGRQVNFRAERYNTGTDTIESWETPLSGWSRFDGVAVPVAGEGVWRLGSGPFAYVEIEVTGIAYE